MNISSIIFNIIFFKFNRGWANLVISARVNLIIKLLYLILKLTSSRLNSYIAA
jgi:ABC-type uncharacterized transport system involved in gliding motility auxiliary subunit